MTEYKLHVTFLREMYVYWTNAEETMRSCMQSSDSSNNKEILNLSEHTVQYTSLHQGMSRMRAYGSKHSRMQSLFSARIRRRTSCFRPMNSQMQLSSLHALQSGASGMMCCVQ